MLKWNEQKPQIKLLDPRGIRKGLLLFRIHGEYPQQEHTANSVQDVEGNAMSPYSTRFVDAQVDILGLKLLISSLIEKLHSL